MNIPIQKLKAIILYFCDNTDQKFLGKVKLMKLFYFLDFVHVKNYASPVTYDRYVKLEHGPIPSTIKNLVDGAEDVENSVLADIIDIERPDGTMMCKVVPRRSFSESDRKFFSHSELEVLSAVCQRFGKSNTSQIEAASHAEAPWSQTEMFDEIPYTLAALDLDCRVSSEEIKIMLEIAGVK